MKNDDIKNVLSVLDSKLNRLLNQSEMISPSPYTLYAWFDIWIANYKRPTLSASYMRAISCAWNYIKQNLVDKPLNEYGALEIKKAVYAVPLEFTRYHCYNLLNGCFLQAVRLGYILSNPLDEVERVKHIRKVGRALTLTEQREFLAVIEDSPRRVLYQFYLLSGVRCSEALGLRWSDIDFEGERIHIHGTKTPHSDRFIPLFPQLKPILADLRRDSGFIFPYTDHAVKSHFQRLKRDYGFTFRLHDLRHTFATRCIESGISLLTVSKWLGHTSISTTASIYAHLLTDFERQEVARFDPKL